MFIDIQVQVYRLINRTQVRTLTTALLQLQLLVLREHVDQD